MSDTDIKEVVKEKYGQAALRVTAWRKRLLRSRHRRATRCCDPITSNLYDASQADQIPAEAMLASLGCGNPTALAKLNPGEVVLDLGLRRRHRCSAVGEARRANRQSVWPRYDG